MNAWDALKALSRLTTGSAWDLLTHPRELVGTGVIVNSGVYAEPASSPVEAAYVARKMAASIETPLNPVIMPGPVELEIPRSVVTIDVKD